MTKHQRFANSDQFLPVHIVGRLLVLTRAVFAAPTATPSTSPSRATSIWHPRSSSPPTTTSLALKTARPFRGGLLRSSLRGFGGKIAELGLRSVLDIGCGEGFYSRKLAEKMDLDILAFDISKDSILLAAKSDSTKSVKWFVGDLTKLPIQDKTIDGILDIFSQPIIRNLPEC